MFGRRRAAEDSGSASPHSDETTDGGQRNVGEASAGHGRAVDVTSSARAVAASVRDLTKVYGAGEARVDALAGVDLDIYAGEFTAIMGPSGSGKSTLMHCAAGLDAPTTGRIEVGGTDLGSLPDKDLTQLRRDRVGFVFQAYNLVPTLTAEENITLPLAIAGRKPDPQWYRTVIEAVGLGDRLGHKPTELSGGQQQRVACARAMVSRPHIIFADEPTGNLDSRASAEVLRFLRRCVDEFAQTVVMVTHDPVAASYTDRVVFLADGRVVDELRNPSPDLVLAKMAGLDPTTAVPAEASPASTVAPAAAAGGASAPASATTPPAAESER